MAAASSDDAQHGGDAAACGALPGAMTGAGVLPCDRYWAAGAWRPLAARDGAACVEDVATQLADASSGVALRSLVATSCARAAAPAEVQGFAEDVPRWMPGVQLEPVGAGEDGAAKAGWVPSFKIHVNCAPGPAPPETEEAEGALQDGSQRCQRRAWARDLALQLRAARPALAAAVRAGTGWLPTEKAADFSVNVEISATAPCGLDAVGAPQDAGSFRVGVRLTPFLWRRLARAHAARAHASLGRACWAGRRAEAIVDYDPGRFPFAALLAKLFGLAACTDGGPPEQALAQMHHAPLTRKPLYPGLGKAYMLGGFSVPGEWRDYGSKESLQLEASETWQEFMQTYRRFVREVCAPLCAAERLVFQCPPTMRVVLPGSPATIQLHCDKDYPAHWRGEVNFWLPVTRVFGTNSLWLESEPGKGDFRPMELGNGQVLCFNGFECRHHTVRNETGSARVSFDWRAVPEELFEGRAVGMIGDYPAERL